MHRSYLVLVSFAILCSCAEAPSPANNENAPPGADSATAYAGPHHAQHAMYSSYGLSGEQQWDSLHGITANDQRDFTHDSHPDYKVFGWHMYSSGSAYKEYNFSLLWAVSYFCYQVDPATGSYKNVYDWKTTSMIDKAKESGCKALLTVGNFGTSDNTKLLDNPKAIETLGDSLVSLLKLRGADGITIDFEGIPGSYKDKFSKLIVSLSQKLKAADPNYMITLALYAVDYQGIFDIKSIDAAVDTYVMMGYDYSGSFSSNAGPGAPLMSSATWGQASLDHSVQHYLDAGVSPSKFILGLPYYGGQWEVDNETLPSKAKKFDRTASYRTIRHKLTDSLHYVPKLDEQSASSYYAFTENGIQRQVWFEDSLSLSVKYDYIRSKGLAGAGIWALGYDHGYNELWNLLGEKFGKKK